MRLLKSNLLWLVGALVFSLSVNANSIVQNGHGSVNTYENKTIEQHTSDGVKYISVSPSGEVFNVNEIIGMSGSGRLNKINARYTRNTSAISQNGVAARLESNKITKDNIEVECKKFLQKNSEKLGIVPSNLRLFNVMTSEKMLTAVFFQTYNGSDIRNSFVRMYVYPNGKIQTFASMYYDDIPNNIVKPSYTEGDVVMAATLGLIDNNTEKKYQIKTEKPVILPVFNGNGYDYKYVIETDLEIPGFELFKATVDIKNYELLQRRNLVFNADVEIKSNYYTDPNQPLVEGTLRNLEFNIEGVGNVRTTSSGRLTGLPSDIVGKKWKTNMVGNYATIKKVIHPTAAGSAGSQVCSFEGTITADGEILMTDSNDYDEVLRTIYNNVSAVRSYYAAIDPQSPLLSNSIMCYAQIIEPPNDLTGFGYNFNASALGDGSMAFLCANHKTIFMGKLNKVLFHEYGHSMVFSKYTLGGQNYGMLSLMANEANADITAAFMTDNPRVFEGISKTGVQIPDYLNLYRNCENNHVYPDHIIGEGHYDSQILSGAFWDFKKNAGTNYFEDVKSAVHFAKEYLPDGFTPESVFSTWFEALVKAADRNTPEFVWDEELEDWAETNFEKFEYLFEPVYHAFNSHKIGFDMLINEKFTHTDVSDQLDASSPIAVSCEIEEFAAPKVIEEVYLNYYSNFDNEVKSILLTRKSSSTGNTYSGEIPAQAEGSRVFYHFTYKDPFSGNTERINRNFFCFSGYDKLHENDCEAVYGWSVEHAGGNSSNGFSLSTPTLVYTIEQQPWNHILYTPNFTTSGSKCWKTNVTTNSSGNIITIRDSSMLVSPTFSFTEHNHIFLTFQKWHICRIGDHSSHNGLFVDVSFDGGNTWRRAQTFTTGRQKPNNWDWQREYVNLTKVKEAGEDFSNLKVRLLVYSNNANVGLSVLIDDITLLGSNNANKVADTYINELSISPNPVSNEATLSFPYLVVNPNISVSNTLGSEVLNIQLQGEYNFAKINTFDLPNGVYFLKATSEGKIYQTKLVIVR